MLPSIRKTADLVREITAASEEQSAGTSQISNAMAQLNSVTQQNASASEELAATAEELGSQAEQLQHTMTFFRLDANSAQRSFVAPGAAAEPVARNAFAPPRAAKGAGPRSTPLPVSEGDFERY